MTQQTTKPGPKHGRDMTSGNIPRHIVAFSIPMLAGNLIQTAYSIVNAIWVGKGLGEAPLAAVTVSFPIIFMLIAVALGMTMGASILVSQFAGAREWERLRKVVQTSTVLLLGMSAAFLVLGQLFAPWIVRQMQTPSNVYPLAVSYLRVMLLCIPFQFGIFLVVSLLRGVGDSKTPLYFQTAGLIGTALLDPALMFGWLGCPRLGLNGTAVASVIMQGLGMLAMFVYLHHKDHIVTPRWRELRVDWPTLVLTVKIGLPSAAQQAMVSIGMLFVIGIVNGFGEDATAAFGAAMRIDQIAFMPAMTFGAAVSTLAGQNIGAGQTQRVKEVFKWGAALSGGIAVVIAFVAVTIPHILLRMFLNDSSALRIGAHYLRIVGFAYISFSLMFVANGVINGAGYTFVTTIITMVALWAARVPLAVYLSRHMHRVEGVFWAMAISSAISMLASLGCYMSGFWKKPIVRHNPQPGPMDVIEPIPVPE